MFTVWPAWQNFELAEFGSFFALLCFLTDLFCYFFLLLKLLDKPYFTLPYVYTAHRVGYIMTKTVFIVFLFLMFGIDSRKS